MIHEDFVYPEQSRKSLEYAKWFDVIEKSHPRIGLGLAMDKMFKLVETDYLFYLQDDWEFERPIELNRLIWTMEKYTKINCITFNKQVNSPNLQHEDFRGAEYDFDGLQLSIYPGWQFLPGIWRMSKVREKWQYKVKHPEGHWQKQFGDNKKRVNDINYLENEIGAYFLGRLNEYRYVRHIGNTWRMAEWQLQNNNYKPSGKRHWDFANLERDRAPWLDKLPARPFNTSIVLDKEGRDLLATMPKYIQEIYG
jgi:hypothetical protein